MKTEQFEKLSLRDKRIAVAKDVIRQVNAEKYLAERGTYAVTNENARLSQRTLTGKDAVTCRVCAYGAAALSVIRLDNKFESADTWLHDREREELCERIFTDEQMALMEMAFEGWSTNGAGVVSEKTAKFYFAHPDSEKRLIAIFRNVIQNNGTFKP